MSNARVNSSCLGFCVRSYYILERLSKYVDGSVDAVRFINPFEVVIDGDAATSFRFHEISGVGRYIEDHVAGVEANDRIGICVEVFHDPVCLFHGAFGSFVLHRSYLVEGYEDVGLNLAV